MEARASIDHPVPVVRVSPNDGHYFFGYYDKFPTNLGDRRLLALRVPFMDHLPGPDEPVTVGCLDLDDTPPRFTSFGTSNAWCWQQANMLQWLPEDPERLVIHNDFRDGTFVAVVRDAARRGAEVRVLPCPIYTLSQRSAHALSLNFARVYAARAGYGYPNTPDPYADHPAPDTDGVWLVNTVSGNRRLVLALQSMAALDPDVTSVDDAHHWVNHIQLNPAGTRFACLHRFRAPGRRAWITRLITADLDGGNPRVLAFPMVSHYDWFDDTSLLAWAHSEPLPASFYLISDQPRESGQGIAPCRRVAGDCVTRDGHCNFSPDRRFFVNDTYPRGPSRVRTLMLVRWEDEARTDIGHFHAPPELDGEFRCDLHPNWFRNGRAVCIDSVHEGFRGMYVVDVSALTG